MTRSAAIGDRTSAIERVNDFVQRARDFLGRDPATVIAFAEDYDALDLRAFTGKPYRIVRGPSVEEYR